MMNEAINYITKLKGLGIWSAEMFLMFNLNRPDIFPIKDIGLLQSNFQKLQHILPSKQKIFK